MYSEEYIRDLEMSAHLYKQEQEKLKNVIEICPVCGRKYEKHWWRSPCCGVEMIWTEKKEGGITMKDVKINMTNQEAIEALQEYAISRGLPKKMVDAFGKAIRALEEQPEWISVSDRLPANANTAEKEYLVQFPNGGMTILNYYDGWNCFVDKDGIYCNDYEITDILFWMELPKPKEVDEDDV